MSESETIDQAQLGITEKKRWGFWGTVLLGALIILIAFVAVGTLVLLALFEMERATNPSLQFQEFASKNALTGNPFFVATSTIVTALTGTFLIWLAILAKRGYGFKDYLRLHSVSIPQYLLWIGLLVLFMIGMGILTEYMQMTGKTSAFAKGLLRGEEQLVLLFIAVCLAAPIFEELIMRGFILEGLRDKIGSIAAILASSLVFAVLHQQYDYFTLSLVFAMGVFFGIAKVVTNSLWVPIVLHSLQNTLSLTVAYFMIQSEKTNPAGTPAIISLLGL